MKLDKNKNSLTVEIDKTTNCLIEEMSKSYQISFELMVEKLIAYGIEAEEDMVLHQFALDRDNEEAKYFYQI